MIKNKFFLALGFSGLIVLVGYGFYKWYFNPKRVLENQFETWNKRIKEYKNDTLTVTKNSQPSDLMIVTRPDFDIVHFVILTDSLLTSIAGKQIKLTVTSDTVVNSKSIKTQFYFDPGKGSKIFRLWVKRFTYTDKEELNKDFSTLHKQANGDAADDMMPGLTYTNDYVIKTERQIFWLNTGCIYAYSNHQKVKQNLLKSINIDNITDSIICKCGQARCKP